MDSPANKLSPEIRRAIVVWWLVGAALWITVSLADRLQSLLIQITLALFLSFALEPMVIRLEKRGVRRSIGAAICLLAAAIVFLVFAGLMGQLIATQLNDLIDELPAYLESGQQWAKSQFGIVVDTGSLADEIQTGNVSGWASDVAGNLVSVGTSIASLFFQILTVLLLTYYLSADGPRMRRTVCSLLPPARQHEVLRVWNLAIQKTGAYISSRVILAAISGVFHYVVFAILDLPSGVALAVWVGVVSQFIPAIGTYLAGILPALVALGSSPGKALWVIAAVLIYQQIENYWLQPKITAQTLDLHPGVSIVAVLAGTALLGGVGAVLALPFVATLTGFVSAYVQRHELVEDSVTPTNEPVPD